jgi:hypothetical protein
VVAEVGGGIPPGFNEGVAEERDVGIGFEDAAAGEEVKAHSEEECEYETKIHRCSLWVRCDGFVDAD